MNICILSHRYPYEGSMVHVFVKKLVDEWAKMGHRCIVISPLSIIHVLAGKEKVAPRIQVYSIGDGKEVVVYRPRYFTIPKMKCLGISLNGYIYQRCIEEAIQNTGLKFDVIYCHFFGMGVIGWHYADTHNIPFFIASGESTIMGISKPCLAFSLDKFRNTLSGVIAVSTKNKEEAIKKRLADESRIKVFPNGANLHIFKRLDKIECRKKLGFPLHQFIIICVGQFVERKGQKRILKALDILNNKEMNTIFVGKGEDNFEHDSILFKGVVENERLPEYLNAADLFVLPTQNEGCCNAIIEALACGLPVVSSDKSFNYDVLNSNNSILVDPDNIQEIALAIDSIFKNKDKRELMAQKAFEKGQSLSIDKRAERIMQFMQQKIDEGGQR